MVLLLIYHIQLTTKPSPKAVADLEIQKGGFSYGRLSFHPIPCGSRDRPAGRKVIANCMY